MADAELVQPCQLTPLEPYDHNSYTCGQYATEADSVADLTDLLVRTRAFAIYSEVRGHYLHPMPGRDLARPRIDLILSPQPHLLDAGWDFGFIGIECKRSREKIGRPVSQMLDYTRSAWDLDRGRRRVLLNWIFLWPLSGLGGAIASVMAQNCLGGLFTTDNGPRVLTFHSGGATLARFRGSVFEIKPTSQGRKVGSR